MELKVLMIAEEKNKEILKSILFPLGYKVEEAKMSRKALENLEKEEYRIIFLQISKLDTEEVDFLRTLRDFCPSAKIVPVVSEGDAEKILKAMGIEYNMYLVLPLDESKIKEVIKDISFSLKLELEFKQKKINPKIMIVDDDKFFGQYLKDILVKGGYEVAAFQSPLKAQEDFKVNNYNILMVDLIMDEMSGEEFIKYTKALDPDVLVIIVTAYPTFDSVLRAIKIHVYDYIIKPFNERDVFMIIKRGWERQKLIKYQKFLMNYIKENIK